MIKEFEEILKNLDADNAFLHQQLQSTPKNDQYGEFQSKNFSIKDLNGITYKTIAYWEQQHFLIGYVEHFEGWRRFGFVELIWIRILDTLRNMGVALDKAVPSIFKALGYVILTKEIENEIYKLPENEQQEAWKFYGNSRQMLSNFCTYVLYVVYLKSTVLFRVYADGSCKISTKAGALNDDKRTFVSVSLNEIINDYIIKNDEKTIEKVAILNDNELELLKFIRKKEVIEVNIKMDNGKPFLLEIKDQINYADTTKRVVEFINSPYAEISFKTNGGKSVSFERITKLKLK